MDDIEDRLIFLAIRLRLMEWQGEGSHSNCGFLSLYMHDNRY